jgi:hypothetical protein
MSNDNTQDAAKPSPASAGSVGSETAIDSRTLAVKLHAVAAAACYGDQAIRDWLHIAANHIAIRNMGITGCGRWIPVTEQRPPDCQAVLAYDQRVPADDAIAMLSFNVSSGEWSCPCAREGDPAYDYEPTHWMPRPAPPLPPPPPGPMWRYEKQSQ